MNTRTHPGLGLGPLDIPSLQLCVIVSHIRGLLYIIMYVCAYTYALLESTSSRNTSLDFRIGILNNMYPSREDSKGKIMTVKQVELVILITTREVKSKRTLS